MADDKMKVSWDDLKSEGVEEKIKQQQAIEETRKAYESAPAPQALLRSKRTSLWYNTVFYMTFFGLIGGLCGWTIGELFHFRPNQLSEAKEFAKAKWDIEDALEKKLIKPAQAEIAINQIEQNTIDNQYYPIEANRSLSDADRKTREEPLRDRDEGRNFVADVLFFGISGLIIGLALGAADSIVSRNYHSAVINGAVGATFGLLGSVVAAACIDYFKLYDHLLASSLLHKLPQGREIISHSIIWGILGLFISLAPGLVMRNPKRLLVGLLGGLIGGLIGGALFDPIAQLEQNPEHHLSRLIGIVAIGLLSGLFTGLIENAAKSGWLRVVAGLIAGKQFVLYRNPTYIGSAPQCQVYLFKDPQVGRRHAALHIIPEGYELEDLPLGGKTFVNGKPINRARLRPGDRIQIGGTAFIFQEKAHAA